MWPCVEHVKLQREVASETGMSSIPRNGIDFLVNGHFGKYGQLGLTAISTTIPPVQLNVIQVGMAEMLLEIISYSMLLQFYFENTLTCLVTDFSRTVDKQCH